MTGASATVTIDARSTGPTVTSIQARMPVIPVWTRCHQLRHAGVDRQLRRGHGPVNDHRCRLRTDRTTEAVGYTSASTITVTQAPAFEGDSKTLPCRGGRASADQRNCRLALSAGTSFADMAGNTDDHTADSDSDGDLATNQTYTLDNGAAVPDRVAPPTRVRQRATSSGGLSVTGTAGIHGVRYSIDRLVVCQRPGLSGLGENTVYVHRKIWSATYLAPASITFTLDTTGPGAASVARFDGETGVDTDGIVDFTVTLNEPVDPATFS